MDFEWSKSQQEIRKAAMEFAKGEFDKERCLEMEAAAEFPERIWRKAGQLGFIGMHYPEAYMGQDLGMVENVIVAEEFCRRDSTVGCALTLAGYGAECIGLFGSEALKERFLPEVAEARAKSAAAFAESAIGGDISGAGTHAVHDDGWFTVSGKKRAVVNGGDASFYIVLCNAQPRGAAGGGSSLVLVEADREGVVVKANGDKLGMRMTKTADVEFNGVRVPADNLIGREGQGEAAAREFGSLSRILIAAQAVGMAQGVFERAVGYIKERVQFGRRIAEFQISRHKIAELATAVEQARLLTYCAAWNYDAGKKDERLPAMAKNAATKIAVRAAAEAIQLFGGYGFVDEYEVESFYRDAKIAEVFEGNRELQNDHIGQSVIGRLK